MADKLNVVAVCGSLRKGSFNRMLMNASMALAPEGMAIKEAPPFGGMPIYNFDDQQAGFPASVNAWCDAIPSTSSESGHTAAPVVSEVLVSIAQRVIRFGTCPVLTARGC